MELSGESLIRMAFNRPFPLTFVIRELFSIIFSISDLNNLPKHTLNGNGLLITNPDGAHPIYELTRRAKFEWGRKHRRASKTLRQAVDEYKRRYGRLPPRGFDHWCVTTRCHQLNSISR